MLKKNKIYGIGIFAIMLIALLSFGSLGSNPIDAQGGYIANVNVSMIDTINWQGYFGTAPSGSYGYNNANLWQALSQVGGDTTFTSGNVTSHVGYLLISNSSNVPVVSNLIAGDINKLDSKIIDVQDKASNIFINTSSFNIGGTVINNVDTVYLFDQNSQNSASFPQGLLEDNTTGDLVFIAPLSTTYTPSYNGTNVTYQYIVPKVYGFNVFIILENANPVIFTSPATTATENVEYLYVINATDADGDSVTYGADHAGFSLMGTNNLTWTPTQADVDNSPITVIFNASDGNGGYALQPVNIIVTNVNDAPTANVSLIPSPAYTTDDLVCSFTAADADTGTYLLHANITWYNSTTQVNTNDTLETSVLLNGPLNDHLVISEVNYDDGANEYVELFNPSSQPITISSTWNITDGESNDALCYAIIPPGGHYLIADNGGTYAGIADCTTAAIGNGLQNDDDSVRIINTTGSVIDAVGWGAEAGEGTPATDAASGLIVRSPEYSDTDDNSVDFAASSTRAPQSTANPKIDLENSLTAKGETWLCQLTIFDSNGGQNLYNSTPLIIQNSLPVISNVGITPATAYVNSNLTVNGTYSDADNDPEGVSKFRWYVDDAFISETTQYLNTGNFSKNNNVTFEYTPYDGTDYGLPVNASIIIQNTIPVITDLNIVSSDGNPGFENSTLTTNITYTDLDSDALTYTYTWYNNSAVIPGATTQSIDGTYFNKYDNVTVMVTPFDGDDLGAAFNSTNAIYINNSAPLVTVTSPNGGVTWSNTQIITWNSQDYDGDSISYNISYLNSSVWYPVVSNISDVNTYVWTLPNATIVNSSIRITATDGLLVSMDESDAFFNISPIDAIAPTVTILSPVTTNYTSQTIDFNITTDELVNSCDYALNNSVSGSLTGPNITFNSILDTTADGSFTLDVNCTDPGNNIGTSSITFDVDSTAPIITINTPTATVYNVSDILLNISINEIGTCTYSVNSGVNTTFFVDAFTNETTLNLADSVSNRIDAYCSDVLGNLNSNSVVFEVDTTAPANITLNAVQGSNEGEINLSWTSVGDDGSTGTATSYVIKTSGSEITSDAEFDAATTVVQAITPQAPGNTETLTLTGLVTGTQYHYAIKAVDNAVNYGGLSNSASARTITHDIGVDFMTHSNENTTTTLYDIVSITSNVTNYGDIADNVTVKLIVDDNYATPYDSQLITLNVAETKQVNFSWNATINGAIDNRKIEVYAELPGDNDNTNDGKSSFIEVHNMSELISLSFVSGTQYPVPDTSGNENGNPFYVYVQLDTLVDSPNIMENIQMTLDADGMTIASTSYPDTVNDLSELDANSVTNSTVTYNKIAGNGGLERFFWRINPVSGSHTITVNIGNNGNDQTITRTIDIP